MTPDPYRIAYETALSDISEITAKVEQLRVRKNHLEHLITVMQSIFASDASRLESVSASAEPAREAMPMGKAAAPVETTAPEAEAPSDYSYLDVPNPLPESDGDPFQRRAKTSFRFRGLTSQRSY
jgi:hypothetical protein